jgi:hypothetical protein
MDKRKNDLTERYGEKRGKSIAYAIATQQAHKVKKSPKGFRTPTGVRVAKAKHDRPLKEYRKTAGAAEAAKTVAMLGVPAVAGSYLGLRLALPKRTREKIKQEWRDPRLYSNLRGVLTGESRAERVAAHKKLDRSKDHSALSAMREGWSRKHKTAGVGMDETMIQGFSDEFEKIALSAGLLQRAATKSMQRAGGRMTTQAQKFHRAAWQKQQATRKALAPRAAAFKASQGRLAKKPPKPGLFSRMFGGGRAPQPSMAGV